MVIVGVEEVQTTVLWLDAQGVLVGLVLENQLLQIVECLLVLRPLAHLHQTAPEVLGLSAMAVVAHLILNCKLHDKDLLQHCAPGDLSVNCQLHLDTLRVLLRPDEASIHQLHLLEAL